MRKKKKHDVADLSKVIKERSKKIYHQKEDDLYEYDMNTFFTIKETVNHAKTEEKRIKHETPQLYARKYELILTDEQKKIVDNQIKESIAIYNAALKCIKKNFIKKGNSKKLSFYSIRKELYEEKHKIKKYSTIHILDCAIKKAVTNYKSAISNFQNGNIKKFRIRYYHWNKNVNKNVYFEKTNFLKGKNKISEIGEVKIRENKKEVVFTPKNIKHEFTISKIRERYEIIFIFDREVDVILEKEKWISLDPGISPFLYGVTKTNKYEIGSEVRRRIDKRLDKVAEIDKSSLRKKIKNKIKRREYRKIKYLVDELHWKTINFLTKKFDTIYIGDLSTKDCVEQDSLSKRSKAVLSLLSLFKFKQRLEARKMCNFEQVNEYYTSKTCSMCGFVKKDLGYNKLYDCNSCKSKMHRDLNGARNIYFVTKIKN